MTPEREESPPPSLAIVEESPPALENRRLRELFHAPEIERYLGREYVDLAVTDQFEAVLVRVRRGVEVVENRARAAALEGRRRLAQVGILAGGAVALEIAALAYLVGRPLLFAASQILVFALLALVVRSARSLTRDVRTLEAVAGRYRKRMESARTIEELLAVAESIRTEVRRIAGAEESEDGGA